MEYPGPLLKASPMASPAREADGPPTVGSLRYVEDLWERGRSQPQALPRQWQEFFQRWSFDRQQRTIGTSLSPAGFFDANGAGESANREPVREDVSAEAAPADTETTPASLGARVSPRKQAAVSRLIESYRMWGHLAATIDPLGRPRPEPSELTLAAHGLSDDDLDQPCFAGDLPGPAKRPLRDIIAALRTDYCGTVGIQYVHVDDPQARAWLRRFIERGAAARPLSRRSQRRILHRLTAATSLEEFLRKKFVGAKTFSLAGGESLIPLLDTVIERASSLGVFEIVMGMAHRGRLNVLINTLGQPARGVFRELENREGPSVDEQRRPGGDVRYHLGYSSDWLSQRGDRIHLSLAFNPSHLEFVNPVALGRMRAKQQRTGDEQRRRGMTLLLHGDASFAGEGIVQESLNLARLSGYATGGTIHVVINNQLGFTTDPDEGRSTTYASDIALAFGAPVLHVNGDDAEAVCRAGKLAVAYRQKFGRDIVIDLNCYRRWGHNEADEPSFTQPQMYAAISSHPSVREIYLKKLLEDKRITAEQAKKLEAEYLARLQSEFESAQRTRSTPRTESLGGVWAGFVGGREPADDAPPTAVAESQLKDLLGKLIAIPDGFQLDRKLAAGLARRGEMVAGSRPLDWSAAEALALASLAAQGRPVRLTGQDTARGTFSQRHAVWHDTQTGQTYTPLAHLGERQGAVEIINSPLCEAASLGFEYGFSLDYPEALVLWEAQFGDFWNAAQVIFDQFLASAEDKWSRLSGLVLLLPHGFEGQGPEHSSARLERILALTANHNIQVVVPSTPAQLFHCLRRQVLRRWCKPLVVLTPKSLLRHHGVVSSWDELSSGGFERVLDDPQELHGSARRVLLCTGKLYYDLLKAREERGATDVALVRIEQFYPLPPAELQQVLGKYHQDVGLVWVQEEPANMGAWPYLQVHWNELMPAASPLVGIARPESASPATGSHGTHKLEQQLLIARAFDERT